jgi:hypothetical protein
MGTSAFFHCSSRFFQRHQRSAKTGCTRFEESTLINSVAEEEAFFNSTEDDLIDQAVQVLRTKGSSYVRSIPFDKVWERFWGSVKEHYFVFEERKVAIVYFFNSETSKYIGPLYDSGPRFRKEECTKRYSLFGKTATVCDQGRISKFTK